MRINFIQNIIDLVRQKHKKIYNRKYFIKIQQNIEKHVNALKKQLLLGQKIKVAFLFMYATDCQNISVFDEMLKSDIFDPYFIINPDIMRSKENFDFNYKRSKDELINKYGAKRVLDGYDYKKSKFIDYTSYFDIATTNNPYDNMANEYFKIEYWAKKSIPIFYISYFYMGRCYVGVDNLKSKEFSYLWKIFAENKFVLKQAMQYEIIKGENIVISGSPKMDKLANIKSLSKSNKMIIIAPHHTIDDNEKSVGGFLQYSELLLLLPQKYPNINFIFRPHPLLFENLRTKYWGKEKSDKYLAQLLSNDNVIYSTEGDYLKLFAESDALIHDCGSFCAEYLYTGKPCAYLYKNGINPDAIWTDFGKECISMHYVIHSNDDLDNFIKNIVLENNDSKKIDRINFANQNLMLNYPNSTKYILENISARLQ